MSHVERTLRQKKAIKGYFKIPWLRREIRLRRGETKLAKKKIVGKMIGRV